jgi:hypothetical protein
VDSRSLRGELEGLAPWTQDIAHGVFIAFEEAGYALIGVAFLFAGLALSAESRVLRTVIIVAGALLAFAYRRGSQGPSASGGLTR